MTIGSLPSANNLDRRMVFRLGAILALLTIFSVGVYLLASRFYYQTGFPLDDAWIHQTYARNLALHGEWSFNPGTASGGSTSPLWTAFLALGYFLRLVPFAWAFLGGACSLWAISVMAEYALRKFIPAYAPRFPWIGAVFILEWHLTWSAVSGMETLLFALLITTVLVLLILNSRRFFGIGLLIGAAVWVRPDGVTLLGPALLMSLLVFNTWKQRLRAAAKLAIGFGSPFALYLLFNLRFSGNPWPNTFYAKQAEYAAYLQLPFVERLGNESLQLLIGVGVALLPGAIFAIVHALRRRLWGVIAASVWVAGFLVLYAWRLPVTYQHGRYVIPAIPIFLLIGLIGMVISLEKLSLFLKNVIPLFWRLSLILLLFAFWLLGARSYAQDVAFIESEMVATAKWVSINIPPKALVAAHDIGAMGFYGGHELVDMAGLVTPEVVPFLRDDAKLADYLTSRKVSYLVVFPDWYPSLTKGLSPVFDTNAPLVLAQGQTNMTVFRWIGP